LYLARISKPSYPYGKASGAKPLLTPPEIKRRPDPGPAERCSRAARTYRIALRNCSRNSLASARSDSHSRRSRAEAESGGSDERHMTRLRQSRCQPRLLFAWLRRSPPPRRGATEERI